MVNPTITFNLISPNDGQSVSPPITQAGPGPVNYIFSINNNLDSSSTCFMTNNEYTQQVWVGSASNNVQTTVPIRGVREGRLYWNVSCRDSTNALFTSPTRLVYIDYTAPFVNPNSPANAATSTSQTVNFNFNAVDNVAAVLNCALYIDGTQNAANSQTPANTSSTLSSPAIANGQHSWYITCTDSAGNVGTSPTRTLTINAPSPPGNMNVTILGPDDEYNTTSPNVGVYFRMNGPSVASCNVYLDGIAWSGNAQNNVPATISVNVAGRQGRHIYYVECLDGQGNSARSLTKTFTYDVTAPVVSLNDPNDGATISTGSTTFRFIATDNVYYQFTCVLRLNGADAARATIINNTLSQMIGSVPTVRSYSWNVVCSDPLGNSGTSLTRTFSAVNNQNPQPPVQQPTGGSGSLSLTYSLTCTNNRIIVNSAGSPVQGAHIVAWEIVNGTYNGIYEADTEAAGEARFAGCGKHIFVNATKSGYTPANLGLELIACGLCPGAQQNQTPGNEQPATCASDSDCSVNQYCNNQNTCANGSRPVVPANESPKEEKPNGHAQTKEENKSGEQKAAPGQEGKLFGYGIGLIVGIGIVIIFIAAIIAVAYHFWKKGKKKQEMPAAEQPKKNGESKPAA